MKFITILLGGFVLLASPLFSQEKLTLPHFEFPDFSEKMHSSDELKGKPVLIDFWATWCITCAQSIPKIKEIQTKYSPLGLQVRGISIDTKTGRKMNKFLEKYEMNYPLLWDKENSLATPLKFEAIPAMFLFDAEGQLILAVRQFDEKGEEQLLAALKKLYPQK